MTIVHRDRNFRIRVNYDHHALAHFHVDTPDYSLSVSIETLNVLAGSKHAREAKRALEWAAGHRDELLREWNRQAQER